MSSIEAGLPSIMNRVDDSIRRNPFVFPVSAEVSPNDDDPGNLILVLELSDGNMIGISIEYQEKLAAQDREYIEQLALLAAALACAVAQIGIAL